MPTHCVLLPTEMLQLLPVHHDQLRRVRPLGYRRSRCCQPATIKNRGAPTSYELQIVMERWTGIGQTRKEMSRSAWRLTGRPSSAPGITAPPRPVGGGRQQGEGWRIMKFLGFQVGVQDFTVRRGICALQWTLGQAINFRGKSVSTPILQRDGDFALIFSTFLFYPCDFKTEAGSWR